LTVIAAANILFELSGAQQKAAAIKFLEKDREAEIGKALAEAVKKLC
jgi:cell division protein ZapA (FtsZ GTPase activity inhibitor)